VLDYDSRKIHVFDSLGGKHTQAVASIQKWLDQILTPARHLTPVGHLGAGPKQSNNADCGFWAIANGLAYARHRQPAQPRSSDRLQLWLLISLVELLAKCYMNSYWPVGIASAVQYKLSNA